MVRISEPRKARIRLSPGFTSRVNLVTDLVLVMGATFAAHAWVWGLPLGSAKNTLLWTGMALVSVWVVTAAAVRHYASFAYQRSLLDDAAMISTQVAAMVTLLAVLELFAGANTPLP